MAGPVEAMWRLGRRKLPAQAAAFERWARDDGKARQRLSEFLPKR